MLDEEKSETKTCICHTHAFKSFIIVALGTFVGAYCALVLFTTLNRPPMPIMPIPLQPYMMAPMQAPIDCPCYQKKMIKKFIKEHKDFMNELQNDY